MEVPKRGVREIPLEEIYWNRFTNVTKVWGIDKLERYLDYLEESIKEKGMTTPPTLFVVFEHEKERYDNKKYHAVHGNHRCEVAKRLGWYQIKCEVK